MNKNSLFMKAYTIFLIICATVRVFIDLPIWPALIMAITVASAIFAWADLDYAMAHGEKEFVSNCWEGINSSLSELKYMKKRIAQHLKEDFVDEQRLYLELLQKENDDLESLFERLNSFIQKQKKSRVKFEKLAKAEMVFGFLSLLCIMTFLPRGWQFPRLQDALTIYAFAIILYTQTVSDRMRKWKMEFDEQLVECNTLFESFKERFELEEKRYAY